MDQLRQLLGKLTLRQRISIGVAVALLVGGVVRWNRERDFRPLFTGLSSEDAGAIVQKLKESGSEYRLSESGGSVLVPSARVSELRLELASAGIPRSGRIGFELFDKTNLGLTDFTEHVNYRRALEGELERSVMSLSEVEQARVHITFPKDSVFIESRQPGKASVLVKLRPGRTLQPGNVVAVTHLVSSAVEGLQPDAVAVLDMNGNLLGRPRRRNAAADSGDSDVNLEYRQGIEKLLLEKVNGTLEPLLGPEGFRASVSVECDFSSGEQSEETFDPSRSVMVASRKSEDTNSAAANAGIPGTASNLPRGVGRPSTGGSSFARRTEDIQYQSSRTVRRMNVPKGKIEKLSVAVLVDHRVNWVTTAKGPQKQLTPPPAEQMNTIRQLVAGSVGLNTDRGDQIVVEALPFDSTQRITAPVDELAPHRPAGWMEMLQTGDLLKQIIAAAILVLAVLGIGAFLFNARKSRARMAVEHRKSVQDGHAGAGPNAEGSQLADSAAAMKLLGPASARAEALLKEVRSGLAADSGASAQVLRVWLQEESRS